MGKPKKILKPSNNRWAFFLKRSETKMGHTYKFLTETSMHGLMHLKSKNKFNKGIWGSIVLVSLFLCTWQSIINIRDYLAYNVITKETYEMVPDIQYPAITIWNSNVFRRTIIGRKLETKFLLSQLRHLEFKYVRNDFQKYFCKNLHNKL